jgi:hypothetical protein
MGAPGDYKEVQEMTKATMEMSLTLLADEEVNVEEMEANALPSMEDAEDDVHGHYWGRFVYSGPYEGAWLRYYANYCANQGGHLYVYDREYSWYMHGYGEWVECYN